MRLNRSEFAEPEHVAEAFSDRYRVLAPDLRGRGVARRLLHELEDRARELGYVIARLDTGPRQAGARRLYESEGYAEVGNFNRNPVASFWGEKPLAQPLT